MEPLAVAGSGYVLEKPWLLKLMRLLSLIGLRLRERLSCFVGPATDAAAVVALEAKAVLSIPIVCSVTVSTASLKRVPEPDSLSIFTP